MKYKRIFVILVLLLCVLPLFAVRRTRVDTSGNTTVKIIWNDAYRADLVDTAQYYEKERPKQRCTRQRISLYGSNDGTSLTMIVLFTDDNAGYYDYKYTLWVGKYVDGLNEDVGVWRYYDFQYNQALEDFRSWESVGELSVQ